MATIVKKKLSGTVKKVLTTKQKEFVELAEKVQRRMSVLYKEGKIDIYDPIR